MSKKTLKVTLVRSPIGTKPNHRATVLGLGANLVAALGAHIEGLKNFLVIDAPGIDLPSTPTALWL